MRKLIVIDHENIIKVFGHIVGLRLDHFILLEYMTKFALSNAKVISSEGINYYWVAHTKAITDMPLVFTTWNKGKRVPASKRTIRRITEDLEKAGLIYKYKDSQKECRSYYGFSDTVIKFFSPHSTPRTKMSEGVDKNVQGARTEMSDDNKLIDNKLKDSSTLGSTTFLTQLFSKLETTYLQQFEQQPSKTWIANQQKKYTQEQIEDVFMRVEAYCVEHTGYPKRRKNLGRVFTQFAKDIASKSTDTPKYVTDGFTKFYISKGVKLDAAKMSNTSKKQMLNIVKALKEHYKGIKLTADRVATFLSKVKKELWFDTKTDLYNVAYLNSKIQEAIATLPKQQKKKEPRKIQPDNIHVTKFKEDVHMDKSIHLFEGYMRIDVVRRVNDFYARAKKINFGNIKQVEVAFLKYQEAILSRKYDNEAQAFNSIFKK